MGPIIRDAGVRPAPGSALVGGDLPQIRSHMPEGQALLAVDGAHEARSPVGRLGLRGHDPTGFQPAGHLAVEIGQEQRDGGAQRIGAVHHDQIELRHYIALSDRFDLTTVVYRNQFARNWYKVNNLSTASLGAVLEDPVSFATEYGWLTGATSPDDAIVIRNNNRVYDSRGIQTILGFTPRADGNVQQSFEFGFRIHEDEEDRLQDQDGYRMDNGSLILTNDAAPGSQANRLGVAEAFSFYAHDEISFGVRVSRTVAVVSFRQL